MSETVLLKEISSIAIQSGPNMGLASIRDEMMTRMQGGAATQAPATMSAIDPASTKIVPTEAVNRKVDMGGAFTLTSTEKPSNTGSLLDQLPSFLMGRQDQNSQGLLVDIREAVAESRSAESKHFDSAIEDYRNAQKESTSYALVSALVQSAMSSFKRLTQGQ